MKKSDFSVGRKLSAYAVLVCGIVLLVAALAMDFSGSQSAARGPMLVAGMFSSFPCCLRLPSRSSFLWSKVSAIPSRTGTVSG